MILSTVSSFPLEQVAETLGDSPHCFQLYRPNSNELTASFLSRAEKAGFSALVVTLDTFQLAWRERDIRHAYLPFLYGKGLANYFSDPKFRSGLTAPPDKDPAAVGILGSIPMGFTWRSGPREQTKCRSFSRIFTEDAKLKLITEWMESLFQSRRPSADGPLRPLDALPGVVDAVGKKITVLFDSGIRRGRCAHGDRGGARSRIAGAHIVMAWPLTVNWGQNSCLVTDVDLSLANLGLRQSRAESRLLVEMP